MPWQFLASFVTFVAIVMILAPLIDELPSWLQTVIGLATFASLGGIAVSIFAIIWR